MDNELNNEEIIEEVTESVDVQLPDDNIVIQEPVQDELNKEVSINDLINQESLISSDNSENNTPLIDVENVNTSSKRIKFSYEILNSQGLKEKGYINGFSKEEVERFLLQGENEILKLNEANAFLTLTIGGDKLKYSELAFILTQLSTYLKAGISLIDSVKILTKQSQKPEQKRIFSNIALELLKGGTFSGALENQGSTFPKLLINMIKTAEATGDLASILDDMADYYTAIDRTRKAAVSAMTYPIFIMIFAFAVIIFILAYVIPEFTSLFEQNNAKIPALTQVVLNASDFLTNNAIFLLGGLLIVIVGFFICFKKIKGFRKTMQSLYMKIPVVGNIMIYKEVAMFTKTFASLLYHNVFITDSINILNNISNNEVYKEYIEESLNYLQKGDKISEAFKGKWAFPIVAYEMLVTGENTGKLNVMMDYVGKYYDDLHSNYVKRLNTFIEPLMIIFLAVVVGVVVLSVIIPMFSFYSQIA